MLGGTVNGGDFNGVLGLLRALAHPDLRPLAERIRQIIIDGNEQGLLAGIDANGKPFAQLADSTYERGRGGLGPPLSPRFSASRFVDRFKVTVEPIPGGGFSILGSWPGVKEVELHRTGTRYMPRRNPVGIRPDTRAKIEAAVNDFARSLVGGRSRFGDVTGF